MIDSNFITDFINYYECNFNFFGQKMCKLFLSLNEKWRTLFIRLSWLENASLLLTVYTNNDRWNKVRNLALSYSYVVDSLLNCSSYMLLQFAFCRREHHKEFFSVGIFILTENHNWLRRTSNLAHIRHVDQAPTAHTNWPITSRKKKWLTVEMPP